MTVVPAQHAANNRTIEKLAGYALAAGGIIAALPSVAPLIKVSKDSFPYRGISAAGLPFLLLAAIWLIQGDSTKFTVIGRPFAGRTRITLVAIALAAFVFIQLISNL